MASPVVKEITHETVTLASLSTTSTDILIKNASKRYYQTYVLTGEAAPTAPTGDPDSHDVAVNRQWIRMDMINSFRPSAASDLYIYCTGPDTTSGWVRVDA